MGVNYGFDKLRFLAPVPAGSNVRGRFKLLSAEDKGGGRWLLKHEVTVEIDGAMHIGSCSPGFTRLGLAGFTSAQ